VLTATDRDDGTGERSIGLPGRGGIVIGLTAVMTHLIRQDEDIAHP